MASWSGWDTETDEKGADAHDNRPYSSLGFDARDVGFSVQNIPPSLPDTFSGQHRDLPPVARTDSASWYLCGKDEFFIPDHASLFGTLPPGYGSHSEVSKHIEAVSPNSSIGEEYQETVSASTSSRPQDGSHGIPLPKFKEAIDKMIKAQNDISTRRLRVQQMRQKLNYKREEEGALRAKVMKRLNVVSTQKGDITPPSSEFEQLQLATDAYLDLERNYNEAEDELEEQEYALFKTLSKLSDFLRQNSTKVTVGTPEVNDYNSDSTSSTTSEAQEIPPTVVQYLSRVGDMHMLRERLSELDSQWLSIADQQSVRQRVGVPMAEESLVFLRSYDGERAQVQSEMNDVLLDMNRLREICYNEGTPVDHCQTVNGSAKDIDNSSPFFESGVPAQPNGAQFINNWILHQLRHSSVEIKRLKSLPELKDLEKRGWDDINISRLALTMWFADDTGVWTAPPSGSQDYEQPNEVINLETSKHSHAVRRSKSELSLRRLNSRLRSLSL